MNKNKKRSDSLFQTFPRAILIVIRLPQSY
uniref:YejG-like protein n=1 Tax=Siphoviridae sp. ctBAZ2 TaxID=2827801 RepID=A0A8S5S7B3_9CAUD|nr:MAG TPA: YejG-like protein [Siphoviridae sp. ctBAZ2]